MLYGSRPPARVWRLRTPRARQVRQADMCGGRDGSVAMFPEASHPLAPWLIPGSGRIEAKPDSVWRPKRPGPLDPLAGRVPSTDPYPQRSAWLPHSLAGRTPSLIYSETRRLELRHRRNTFEKFCPADLRNHRRPRTELLNPRAVALFALQFAGRTRKSYAARAETFWS